jgi:hypothetical protein
MIPYQPDPNNPHLVYISDEISVTRHVVCAANKRNDDGLIICGARHWDKIMHMQADAISCNSREWEQGFIDQFGHFLTRSEAASIVKQNGQNLREPISSNYLYSENLY